MPKAIKPATGQAEIDAYLAALPEPARTTLITVRETLRSLVPPQATEEFSYGVPAFKLHQGIAGYNAGRKFCSFYPMSGRVITKLAADLKPYETTAGSIHFPLDKPLPVALLRKLVKARLAEFEAKK